jgi:hypothetical protein
LYNVRTSLYVLNLTPLRLFESNAFQIIYERHFFKRGPSYHKTNSSIKIKIINDYFGKYVLFDIALLGNYPKEMKKYAQRKSYTRILIAALLVIAPNYKLLKSPLRAGRQ